jgi:hypothetical protein
MLSAQATVETDRPSRYLVQLSRHGSHMSRPMNHRPRAHGAGETSPEVRHAEWSDTRGIITFGWGQCALQATPEGLTLRAEAADEDGLRRIQDGIAARLERIGRRDQLKVNWQQVAPSAAPSDEVTNTPAAPAGIAAHRGRLGTVAVAATGALVVAVHLGLGGAFVAHSRWTGQAADIVLVLVVVKVLVIGRFAVRRGKTSKTPRNLH